MTTTTQFIEGDSLSIPLADRSVDLAFCSPPYEAARTYGIGFALRGQAWVDWAVPRFVEQLRVTRGLVAWVVEGQTRGFRYSATPALLMADLSRYRACRKCGRGGVAGPALPSAVPVCGGCGAEGHKSFVHPVHLRKPPIYRRDGIPGSGGPDWLANKYEFVVCATNGGRLPWSDNTAMGHPPKYGPGGSPSHRLIDGERVGCKSTDRRPDGSLVKRRYVPPGLSNPGNIIDCGAAGGGNMGCDLAHENEAPFPEALAEFFVRSFCPPGGTVFDGFSGSGTTVAVAAKHGRNGIGMDIRPCQVALGERRLAGIIQKEAA